jgi:hypothetical protein
MGALRHLRAPLCAEESLGMLKTKNREGNEKVLSDFAAR